jgi:hypothetical protein
MTLMSQKINVKKSRFMKHITSVFILLLSMNLIIQTGCIKDKFEAPDQNIPSAGLTANLTIAQLKTANSGGLDSISDSLFISGDTILHPVIEGVVSATDESGNLYKTLYIQDNTAGIQIAVDRTSLYTTYRIGQKVFVKLSGLYLGTYGGVLQIGYVYGVAPDPESIGRIPNILIDQHIIKDGLPATAPVPLERSVTSLSGNDMNMLVVLRKVHFAEVGSPYAPPLITTNRILLDSAGNEIFLRNSGYANFRAELMPKGQGDIVCIYSAYNGDNQLYIRDLNDLQNWDYSISFPMNVINEPFTSTLGTFTQYSVQGTQIWTTSNYGAKISGYEAGGYYANEDWLISPSINFDNYTNETLNFNSFMNYGVAGDGSLKLYTSTNYSGTGDPNLATWTEITPLTLSTGAWANTSSGDIDLSGINGTNVHFAFKYTCTTSGVATWEITPCKLVAKPI